MTCGPGWLHWLMPDSAFEPACKHHDEAYKKGQLSRYQADRYFLKEMDALSTKWYHVPLKWTYYYLVRWFGWLRYEG